MRKRKPTSSTVKTSGFRPTMTTCVWCSWFISFLCRESRFVVAEGTRWDVCREVRRSRAKSCESGGSRGRGRKLWLGWRQRRSEAAEEEREVGGGTGLLFFCLFVLELVGGKKIAQRRQQFLIFPTDSLPHVSFSFAFLPSTVRPFFRRRFRSPPPPLGATSGPAWATGGDSND